MDLHALSLTLADLRPILVDAVFRSGQFFTEWGKELDWIAVKLPNTRWTIYFTDSGLEQDKIAEYGSQLKDDKLIKKLVPCTKEVFELYWKGGEN